MNPPQLPARARDPSLSRKPRSGRHRGIEKKSIPAPTPSPTPSDDDNDDDDGISAHSVRDRQTSATSPAAVVVVVVRRAPLEYGTPLGDDGSTTTTTTMTTTTATTTKTCRWRQWWLGQGGRLLLPPFLLQRWKLRLCYKGCISGCVVKSSLCREATLATTSGLLPRATFNDVRYNNP